MLDKDQILSLANTAMPFGKYAGRDLVDLPEEYLLWFSQKGFPKGKLGEMMGLALMIKTNGLEDVVRKLKSSP